MKNLRSVNYAGLSLNTTTLKVRLRILLSTFFNIGLWSSYQAGIGMLPDGLDAFSVMPVTSLVLPRGGVYGVCRPEILPGGVDAV